MAGEPVEALPEELKSWLSETASEADVSEAELLTRAVFTLRLLEDDDALADVDPQSLRERYEEVDRRTKDVADRLSDLESDVDEKIEDVRSRIVQVKHEADKKAPQDHDHAELEAELVEARSAVGDLRDELENVENKVDGGFRNYEEILEHLNDDIDDLHGKANALARVVVGLRSSVVAVEADRAKRVAADELKTEANRENIAEAACETCESPVRIALLSMPRCPHCGENFDGVRPKQGFFGSPTLTTSERPALEEAPEPVSDEPLDVFKEEFDDEFEPPTDIAPASTDE